MRSLNRPMFRMGGPIKEGVMHGIREPHARGSIAGGHQIGMPMGNRTGFADPVRKGIAKRVGAWGASKIPGFTKGWAKRAWDKYKFPPKMQATTPTGPGITHATKARDFMYRAGQYFKKHPYLSTLGPAYLGTTEPVAGTAKAIAGAVPEIAQFGTEVVTPKRWEKYLPPDKWWKWKSDVEWKPGDVRGSVDDKPDKPNDLPSVEKVLTDAEKKLIEDAKLKNAKAAKDKRLTDLLEIMNYDKSRKNAAYDALIDASEVIRETGFKDKSILPIVKATSARFDKPEQIKEAVGLMMAKGEIEKDIAKGKGSQTAQTARDLVEEGVFPDMRSALDHLSKKVDMADTIAAFAAKGVPTTASNLDIALRSEIKGVIPHVVMENKKWKKVSGGKSELEYVQEIKDKKPGYYIIDKRIVFVDNEGKATYKW